MEPQRDPEEMTREERDQEVAEILATGSCRMKHWETGREVLVSEGVDQRQDRAPIQGPSLTPLSEKQLDCSGPRSVNGAGGRGFLQIA